MGIYVLKLYLQTDTIDRSCELKADIVSTSPQTVLSDYLWTQVNSAVSIVSSEHRNQLKGLCAQCLFQCPLILTGVLSKKISVH